MIAPHHGNRKKPSTQDGRSLRRYKLSAVGQSVPGWSIQSVPPLRG
jgi:hypothetical protein